jgi:hypothetical protein
MIKNMQTAIKKKRNLSLSTSQNLVNPNYKSDSTTKVMIKNFHVKYEKDLSVADKILLSSFQRKYLYHAIDDVLYYSKSRSVEQKNLLDLLYSPILYLQNNLAIDFFDIWIDKIYITKSPERHNKFLANDNLTLKSFSYITLKLLYTHKSPKPKPEPLW